VRSQIFPPSSGALGFQDATLANAPSPELHAAWCNVKMQADSRFGNGNSWLKFLLALKTVIFQARIPTFDAWGGY